MNVPELTPLSLGADVVQLLLPHRRPFLFVDTITAYARSPVPALRASKFVSANESVFAGHFPALHLWPGVLTIEGLGQTCNLVLVLARTQASLEKRGVDLEQLLRALRNAELGFTMNPGFDRRFAEQAGEWFTARGDEWNLGMNAAVNVKLVRPVFAGSRIDYLVVQSKELSGLVRFEVEARVDGHVVANGSMTSATDVPSLPGRESS